MINRYHIAFKLRTDRPKKDGTYSIYMYLNLNGKLSWISTGLSIEQKYWNVKTEKARQTAPSWIDINTNLEIYKEKAIKYIQQCNLNDEIVNQEKINKLLRAGNLINENYFYFVEQHIKKHYNNYAPKTIKGFQTHLKKLRLFKQELFFSEINIPFWNDYETYLRGLGNQQNTIHKQYRLLNKFINKAIEHGIIHENLIKDIKIKSKEGNREHLTIEELKKLQEIYNSGSINNRGAQNVLRYFLFACYTGLRYQDVKQLRHKDILNNTLHITLHKTNKLVTIPLSKKALDLLEPEDIPENTVFRVYTNQVTNRHLKSIMKTAEINKNISFHCARHTWAIITLELTGDIALVSNVLGHSDLKTTLIYAKIQEKAKKEAMSKWDEL